MRGNRHGSMYYLAKKPLKGFTFATLDPKTRQIQINEGFNLIISDTVGFIQKLPTTLIAAFKSTLEDKKVQIYYYMLLMRVTQNIVLNMIQ